MELLTQAGGNLFDAQGGCLQAFPVIVYVLLVVGEKHLFDLFILMT